MSKKTPARWLVHTPNLIKEILTNPGTGVLKRPLNIFTLLIGEIAERANQLEDPILTDLLMRLTVYEVADPESPNYERETLNRVRRLAEKQRLKESENG